MVENGAVDDDDDADKGDCDDADGEADVSMFSSRHKSRRPALITTEAHKLVRFKYCAILHRRKV